MSNYRVRQVLALRALSDRRLRLLLALATFMDDDSRSVRAGFAALITVSGRSHNTIRAARRELEKNGQLTSEPGRGRGRLTVWTVLCLPEKGTNVLGTDPELEKVPTEAEKRYQPESADQRKPERGLNRKAKSSSARAADIVRAAFPDAADDEIETIAREKKASGARSVASVIQHEISEGTLRLPCDPTGPERHCDACRSGNGRNCTRPPPDGWCACRCNTVPLEERGGLPPLLVRRDAERDRVIAAVAARQNRHIGYRADGGHRHNTDGSCRHGTGRLQS